MAMSSSGPSGIPPMGMQGQIPSQQQQMMTPHQQQIIAQQQQQQQQQQGPGPTPSPGQPHPQPPSSQTPGPPAGPPIQQPPPMATQEQQRVDNVTKIKALMNPIKESLHNVLRTAAHAVNANNMIDSGTKPVDFDPGRFDKALEEFFSLCDQMEMNLKTAIECTGQSVSSQKYLPTPVTPNRVEGSLTYPQYINLVKGQIAYAKEVHDALVDAGNKL